MPSSAANLRWALGLVVVGTGVAAAGIYVGDVDDAPGAALAGIVLMCVALAFSVRLVRRKNIVPAPGGRD